VNASGWGGARRNSGPKPEGSEAAETQANFDRERAEHERIKRIQREFELEIAQGKYLSRADVSQAAATVIALFTQTVRSIDDDLERNLGVSPEVADAVSKHLDAALSTLSVGLRALAGE